MTVQEKNIIETILTDVGLESLKASGANDHESEPKPLRVQITNNRSEYSRS